MRHVGRRAVMAVLLLGVVACGSTSGTAVTLASYASGRWACSLPLVSPLAGRETLEATGNVTTTSATTGRVTIDIETPIVPGAPKSPPYAGAWSLHSGELVVK